MGYLGVLTLVFVMLLAVSSVALASLSHILFGVVQDWVLFVAAGFASISAYVTAEKYQAAEERRANR